MNCSQFVHVKLFLVECSAILFLWYLLPVYVKHSYGFGQNTRLVFPESFDIQLLLKMLNLQANLLIVGNKAA